MTEQKKGNDVARRAVSIITPMFNSEKYISSMLQSVKQQEGDGLAVELILIDNGSTDNSVEIARELGIEPLLMPDATISEMRNEGASRASNETLMFVDSDCVLPEGWANRALTLLHEHSDAGAIGGNYGVGDNPTWVEKAWCGRRKWVSGDVSFLSAGTMVIKKTIFDEVGGFADNLVTGEDWDLSQKIKSLGLRLLLLPDLEVMHLGNVKNLMDIYRKEKWYGAGMVANLKHQLLSKPLILTFFFVIIHVLAFAFLITLHFRYLMYSIVMLMLMLFAMSSYFLKDAVHRKAMDYLYMIPISYMYLLGRSVSLFKLFLGKR